ncbi:MAG: hydantoinase/oxoprolinase family protein [Bacillota bacterium]|nr:hydantoinase/oxoprolinase family protein [Bacillota bacterium]
MKPLRLAVDIGGTFTDFVIFDSQTGEYSIGKNLTTPPDLSQGVLTGMQALVPDFSRLEMFVHGTTAGINAFLERRGARVAIVTTRGFRDVYLIQRTNRHEMYNLFYRKPVPLVKRRDIFEVDERTEYDGTVSQPISEASLAKVAQAIRAGGYEAVAVCFLHSYANPSHELAAEARFRRELPDIHITLSHRVANEWREYERTSTAVINAYVAPRIQHYLGVLEEAVRRGGYGQPLFVMQSSGGVMTSSVAKELPIQTLFSGPVGGAIGCVALGEQMDCRNLLAVDMGGTSFDVSLVLDGRPDVATETDLDGFPVLMPRVNIYSIGAGGGSMAWIEAGGLRVGPQSAGAMPGPACYGRGGTEPTVTDANLFLGRLSAENFLGGGMMLDTGAAERALARVASELGMETETLAAGILDIVNAKMAGAIRKITVEKGIDPRDFTLVAFGGAGPMHAVFLAQELDISRVVIPHAPGTFSAWGMLQADVRHDVARTYLRLAGDAPAQEMESVLREMEEEAAAVISETVGRANLWFVRVADMRYQGQEYYVAVPVDRPVDEEALARLPDRFHQAHQAKNGHCNRQEAVELVNLRVAAIGSFTHPRVTTWRPQASASAGVVRRRQVRFGAEWLTTDIYWRQDLAPGSRFCGPAVVEETSCTTVIPPGFTAVVDGFGNIVVTSD